MSMNDIFKYLQAQQEAEKKGEHEFVCPICGGKARWLRSTYNNHLHSSCEKCKFRVME